MVDERLREEIDAEVRSNMTESEENGAVLVQKIVIGLISIILSISISASTAEHSFWDRLGGIVRSNFPESTYMVFALTPVGVLGALFYLLICKFSLKEKFSKNFIASIVVGFLAIIGLIIYAVLSFKIY